MENSDHPLWNIVNKSNHLRNIREYFNFDSLTTDEDIIELSERYIDKYLERYYVVIGNELELKRIRIPITALSEGEISGQPIISEPDKFFIMTERLFREGMYIEACIAARFTIERLFQYEVLNTEEFGEQIRGSQRNPEIIDLINFLRTRDGWTNDFYEKVIKIKKHGDWQAHHRFDKMYEGMTENDFLSGVRNATIGLNGVRTIFNEWSTHVTNRNDMARKLSLESMKYLYEIMNRYRNIENND